MFLNIDRHTASNLAAEDDLGGKLSYGDLVSLSNQLNEKVPQRKLSFCMCENAVGALAGFVALYENKNVPLLLDAAIDAESLDGLLKTYSPEYIWAPEKRDIQGEEVLSFCGYKLMHTGMTSPPLNEKLSMLLMTSGSTGSPKLVRHRYGNIEYNSEKVARAFGWTTSDRGICQLPMHYTMGLSVITSHLHAGATVLLCKSNLMSREFWNFIKTSNGTNFTGVPYSYDVMLKMKFTKMDLPALRTLASGGGRLTDENFQKIAEYCRDTDRRFFSTFGATETSARLAYLPPEFAASKIGSIGKEFPGGIMELIDSDENVISVTEAEGELIYRGENVTMGYAENAEGLMQGDEWNGVYRTGDIAKRDSDGCYYIIGRKSRFLKLFGHRVSLDFCEKLIKQKFGTDCVCTGTDKLMSVFVTSEDIINDVTVYLSEKTSLPRMAFKVMYIAEIPRKASGKPDYQLLNNM